MSTGRRFTTPLPLAALLEAHGPHITDEVLGELVGVTKSTVIRAHERGLCASDADRFACRLGLHPLSVWGDAWVDACDVEEYERTHCLRGHERGMGRYCSACHREATKRRRAAARERYAA